MSAALDYHRATNVPAGGTDEDEARTVGTLPVPFKDYGDADRAPLAVSVAGRLLHDGAGIVRSREAPAIGRTIHFRGYSSAGGLFPVEAYVASPTGLFSFDPLTPSLVRLGDDVRAQLAAAAATEVPGAFVVLTGIHARTGWKYMERGYRHIWWDAGTMLANLLALASADDLRPRLHVAFVDAQVNDTLGIDGTHEYALAMLALDVDDPPREFTGSTALPRESGGDFPLALAVQRSASIDDAAAVRAWRAPPKGEEPKLPRDQLVRAIRRRGSVRSYGAEPLPRDAVADLLAWSEAAIPADAPPVVRQWVTVNAVAALEPGIYDAQLTLVRAVPEDELRERSGFAAMEQDHPRLAAFNVWQMADLDAVVARHGDRGYRWAQLEAGIRAGRLQIGAFMRGWGAAASTFFDDEVSKLLATVEPPLLMVALGSR